MQANFTNIIENQDQFRCGKTYIHFSRILLLFILFSMSYFTMPLNNISRENKSIINCIFMKKLIHMMLQGKNLSWCLVLSIVILLHTRNTWKLLPLGNLEQIRESHLDYTFSLNRKTHFILECPMCATTYFSKCTILLLMLQCFDLRNFRNLKLLLWSWMIGDHLENPNPNHHAIASKQYLSGGV